MASKNGTAGKVFVGSAKELSGKILINGKPVTAPVLSILHSYGLIDLQDKMKSASGKGKPTNILRVRAGKVTLDVSDYEPVAAAPVETVEASAPASSLEAVASSAVEA